MKKKLIFAVFIITCVLIFAQEVIAEQVVKSSKVLENPLIDGLEKMMSMEKAA